MSVTPRALVLNAPGINCNLETGFAIEQAGAEVDQVHISQLRDGEKSFDDYQILALSGGFSYGDDIASGRLLGLELRTRFAEDLNRFTRAGKAVLGVCNGFQVLVESGLLPDGEIKEGQTKTASLTANAKNRFECRWTKLHVRDSASRFIRPSVLGDEIELPVAHQEGRLAILRESKGEVPLSYIDENGTLTTRYPSNPNGSLLGATALCDPSGVVNGLMPHPERFVSRYHHPNWRRGEAVQEYGALIFKDMVDYAKKEL